MGNRNATGSGDQTADWRSSLAAEMDATHAEATYIVPTYDHAEMLTEFCWLYREEDLLAAIGCEPAPAPTPKRGRPSLERIS